MTQAKPGYGAQLRDQKENSHHSTRKWKLKRESIFSLPKDRGPSLIT